MLKGNVETYKLFGTVAGNNVNLDFSDFSERMTFIENFSEAKICPFFHRNTVNLLGIAQK